MSPTKMFQFFLGILFFYTAVERGRSRCMDPSAGCTEIEPGYDDNSNCTHIFKSGIPQLTSRTDLKKTGRPDDNYIHEVIFVIQSKNMDELTRIVHDVSDPESVNYGQHMTKEGVVELTSNPESAAAVSSYLHAYGATVTSVTPGDEYITAQAPISVWDRLFNTKFHIFHQTHLDGDVSEVVRAEEYWISKEIDSHVLCVMNTVEMPVVQKWGRSEVVDAGSTRKRRLQIPGLLHEQLITPARLRIYYNISNSKGNSLSTQLVFGNPDSYFSPLRLKWFQGNVSMQPFQAPLIQFPNDGHTKDDAGDTPQGKFSEINLDMQYIMAMSPGSPTTYWRYDDLGISRFIRDVVNSPRPSLVISISYAIGEQYVSPAEWYIYDDWIVKASAIGMTVFSASGDQGAVSGGINGVLSRCKYEPNYPNCSPYTVSVGGTTVSTANIIL